MAAAYVFLKQTHLLTVAVSGALFFLRGVWMCVDSPRLQKRWVRILPHVNDTVLLASAVGLSIHLHQFPFLQTWLTAKIVALVVYIGLGMVAIGHGKNKRTRVVTWLLALLVFAYIVMVALRRDPWPL